MTKQKKKKKKKMSAETLLHFYPKTHPIKSLNSLDSPRPYERLLENQKPGGSRELFLPENDF